MSALVYRVEYLRPGNVTIDWGLFRTEDEVRDRGTFCRVFKLDPFRTRVEFGPKLETGFIFFAGAGPDPIAKVERAREGERFRELEPFNRRDFERLGTTY